MMAPHSVEVSAVTPDVLAWKGSAPEALNQLSGARSMEELLHRTHVLWCGSDCDRTTTCTFLHYPRNPVATARPATTRSRYNKQTACLYAVMGKEGYVGPVAQHHRVNVWPLLLKVVEHWDAATELNTRIPEHYTDWTKKHDAHAADTVSRACRDAIQWMGCWCGERYGADPLGLRYIAFATILDDICIPPLDLLSGRFRMYGWSVRDLVQAMDMAGWARDAVHALLSLIRQSIVQYAEKMDFRPGDGHVGLHAELATSTAMWDGVIFRGHTGNAYGTVIAAARNSATGPVSFTWLMDSAICDCPPWICASHCSASTWWTITSRHPMVTGRRRGRPATNRSTSISSTTWSLAAPPSHWFISGAAVSSSCPSRTATKNADTDEDSQ
jgi:hypothetical protein